MTAPGHSYRSEPPGQAPPGQAPPGPRPASTELYTDLPPTTRRALHRAAAEAQSGDAVWLHRVAAATCADESLAAALESAAPLSAPAGAGRPGAAKLLEWASDLSVDNDDRERRLLAAAIQRICAGELGSASLWALVEACAPSALRSCALAGHAVLQCRRLEAEFHLDRAVTQAGEWHSGVAAVVHGLRAELYLSAGLSERAISEATAGLATAHHDRGLERWLTRLLAEARCVAEGPRAAFDTLADGRIGGASRSADDEPAESATVIALNCYGVLSGDPREAAANLSALVDGPGELPPEMESRARQSLALAYHLLGDWRLAEHHAGYAAHALRGLLAAHRGDWSAAAEHLRQARNFSGAGRPDENALADLAEARIAHARGALLAGHPAIARLARAGGTARKYRSLWLPLRAEALVESGSEWEATTALSELRALAEQVPYLRVAVFRLSGRLAERRRDPGTARRQYEAAQELPPACLAVPFQLGLLEHNYGRLLCGLGSTTEGPAWLDRAADRLAGTGAFPYARRCAADLAARPGPADGAERSSVLTERERAVARLVAAGLTNQQAADRLYVSVKTVEYHLAQIYGKLGIRSRRQLGKQPSLQRN